MGFGWGWPSPRTGWVSGPGLATQKIKIPFHRIGRHMTLSFQGFFCGGIRVAKQGGDSMQLPVPSCSPHWKGLRDGDSKHTLECIIWVFGSSWPRHYHFAFEYPNCTNKDDTFPLFTKKYLFVKKSELQFCHLQLIYILITHCVHLSHHPPSIEIKYFMATHNS